MSSIQEQRLNASSDNQTLLTKVCKWSLRNDQQISTVQVTCYFTTLQ